MKVSSINDLKKELELKSTTELFALCLKLAKFDIKAKEYLSFLIFESDDIENYIIKVKSSLDSYFSSKLPTNAYYLKKDLQKALKIVNKQIKFTANKQVEVEILIHWLGCIKKNKIPIHISPVLLSMERRILKKIEQTIHKMHEDLQFDYQQMLEQLNKQ